jgi:hypothetical protein
MAKYRYEMFANLIYGDALTYEELIGHEQKLTAELTICLQEMGGTFVDFQPLGDALYVQCVFAEQDAKIFDDIGEAVAGLAGAHMEGRLMFFGRDLGRLYCFFLADGKCQGGRLSLPSPQEGMEKLQPRMRYASAKNRKQP